MFFFDGVTLWSSKHGNMAIEDPLEIGFLIEKFIELNY
jgi:hypothetical protein